MRIDTVDDKAIGAIAPCQTGKIKTGAEIANICSLFPKHNVGFARTIPVGISQWRADDQIINVIAIDIACTRNRPTALIIFINTLDDKAAAAIRIVAGQIGQVHAGIKGIDQVTVVIFDPRSPEHDIGFTRITVVVGISQSRPDD